MKLYQRGTNILVLAVVVAGLALWGLGSIQLLEGASGWGDVLVLVLSSECYRRIVDPVVGGFRRAWKARGNREDPPPN